MAKAKSSERRSTPSKSRVRVVTRLPGANTVSLTGVFSNWSESGIEMHTQTGDVWEADLTLAPGRYEYRLRVDGEWRDHPEAAERIPNPFGTENCVLTVS